MVRAFKALRSVAGRCVVVIGVVLAVCAITASSASAEPATLCVKATKTATKPKHYTGGWTEKNCATVSGTHEGKYEKLADFSESEEAQLKALLKYMTVQSSGIDGKPTVKITGATRRSPRVPQRRKRMGRGTW